MGPEGRYGRGEGGQGRGKVNPLKILDPPLEWLEHSKWVGHCYVLSVRYTSGKEIDIKINVFCARGVGFYHRSHVKYHSDLSLVMSTLYAKHSIRFIQTKRRCMEERDKAHFRWMKNADPCCSPLLTETLSQSSYSGKKLQSCRLAFQKYEHEAIVSIITLLPKRGL